MREERGDYYIWQEESNEAAEIMEIAAEDQKSRKETLSLIDFLMSKENYAYKYLYDRYTR